MGECCSELVMNFEHSGRVTESEFVRIEIMFDATSQPFCVNGSLS